MVQPQIVYYVHMNDFLGRLQIGAFREPASYHNVSFYMRLKDEHTGTISTLADPLVFTEKEDPAVYTPPAFVVSEADAQALMEDLWNMGLRPSQYEESAGELKATKKHLQDYRNLVAKLLTVAGVPVNEV